MTEFKQPTEADLSMTVNMLKNIREILKRGLFFGESAGYVYEAGIWLGKTIEFMTPKPEEPAAAEEAKPKLEVVEDVKE